MNCEEIIITQELLDDLELQIGLTELATAEDFNHILTYEKAIIYLFVDWSGPERISRYMIYKILNEMEESGTPTFKID